MCYCYWTKKKAYFIFMILTHLNFLIIWILVSQFLGTWIKSSFMSQVYWHVHRKQERGRDGKIQDSGKDKHRFKAVCVALNVQHFSKLELRLSNQKMRSTSLTIICKQFLWSDFQPLHKDCVGKGKKESQFSKIAIKCNKVMTTLFSCYFLCCLWCST